MNIDQYKSEIAAGCKDKYRTERSIRKHLPEFASYVDSLPTHSDHKGVPMKFLQKLWHVMNDDIMFTKGVCECGKRTKFIDGKYKRFCSTQCGLRSKDTRSHLSKANSSAESLQKMRETCRQRYGTDYASQSKDIHDKQMASLEHTLISKHGTMDAFKEHQSELLKSDEVNKNIRKSLAEKKDELSKIRSSEEWRQKYTDTIIERFGSMAEFSNHIVSKACAEYESYDDFKKDIDAKKKKTILKKHASLEEYNATCREKQMETILAKYGSIEAFEAHRKDTIIAKYGSIEAYEAHRKEIIIAKYGSVEEYNKHIREKQNETIIEKYGSIETYRKYVTDSMIETKRKNHTFCTSSTEEKVVKMLDGNNIKYIRQYKCDTYPFCCDIYLVDYELFIEIQASWTHGKMPFDANDAACQAQLSDWIEKSKTSKYYKNAIEVWTLRDVKKREVAAANNLQYIEIFSNDANEIFCKICRCIINKRIIGGYIDCTLHATKGTSQTQHFILPDIDFDRMADVYYHEDFPYPKYTQDEILKEWRNLCIGISPTYRSRKGLRIVNAFHKSIWHARSGKKSPLEAWGDRDIIRKLYKNRLEYSSRNAFHIVPADYNYRPEYQDIFDDVMREGLTITKKGPKVSVFSPDVARSIIHKYLSDVDIITDPFSGFSGRMLGALSLGKKYIGRDINVNAVNESNRILQWLEANGCVTKGCATVEVEDLRNAPVREVECIMTCPPYRMKEMWEGTDLVDMSCDEWIQLVIDKYKAKRYIFVVDETIEKYKEFVVEHIENKSHFNTNVEYIVVL